MTTAAVIFDMDGLLIDSEPFWAESEVEVFSSVGVPLTEEMTPQTMGLRIDLVVQYWYDRYPWAGVAHADVAAAVVDGVLRRVRERGQALPGVTSALDLVRAQGVPMAVASASPSVLIDAVLERLGLTGTFDAVRSAENEPYSKPHPGVFLSTAAALGVDPVDCVVLEDSGNGVLAAKSARMRCIAVPEPAARGDARFGIADVVLGSLTELTADMLSG